MTGPAFDHDSYAAYLNAHLLASEAGLRAFVAAKTSWADSRHASTFQLLIAHIAADRRDLLALIEGLGYRQSALKRSLTSAARVAGTLNPINLRHVRGQPSTQLELDALTAKVRAKLSMWEALIALQPHDERLLLGGLRQLERRAQTQMTLLQDISQDSVEERFLDPSTRGRTER